MYRSPGVVSVIIDHGFSLRVRSSRPRLGEVVYFSNEICYQEKSFDLPGQECMLSLGSGVNVALAAE